jgi:hypothetical protein
MVAHGASRSARLHTLALRKALREARGAPAPPACQAWACPAAFAAAAAATATHLAHTQMRGNAAPSKRVFGICRQQATQHSSSSSSSSSSTLWAALNSAWQALLFAAASAWHQPPCHQPACRPSPPWRRHTVPHTHTHTHTHLWHVREPELAVVDHLKHALVVKDGVVLAVLRVWCGCVSKGVWVWVCVWC